MLRFADELLLLLIDDKRGDLIPIPERSLGCALAGALLMDLAQEGRIDTDPDYLSLLDPTPLGDDLLDPVLAEIAEADAVRHARFWVAHFAEQVDDIRDRTLARLTAQGILEAEEGGFFSFLPSVSRTRRYPADQARREDVQLRIMRVLFSSDIPEPTDAVIVGPANACGVFERLLPPAEREVAQERIDLLGRMDPIGRAVTEVIQLTPAAAEPHRAPFRKIPVVLPSLNDLLLGRAFVLDQCRKLGPIFQVRKNLLLKALEAIFITKPLSQGGKKNDGTLIFLAGPEANMFFQKNDKDYFHNREFWMRFDEQFDAKATRSMISTSGEDHFRMRRAKRSGYSRAVGEAQLSGILDVTRREVASWSSDKPVIGTAMGKRLVYNLMCRLMAGISAPAYYDDFIALHEPENRGSRPPDIIDHLLALYRSDPQFLPETDLSIAILEPIYAPLDTMAHTISFMLYELLRDPDLLRRARAEADELFAQGTPTTQGIQQLDVIKRAYMETLRLHSTVPLTIRTVSNSFEFAGCTVPAGNPVVLQFTLPHHMAEYFPNPERFDIDRFAPPRDEHQQSGVYMPYGVGTHRCLGSNLAEFMTTATMATLLRDVEFALVPPDYVLTQRKVKRIPTRHPNKSFRFRLVRRRSTSAAPSPTATAGE